MKCNNCTHYDFNDYVNGYGTCEPQDIDYKADHECNVDAKELELVENLIKNKKKILYPNL